MFSADAQQLFFIICHLSPSTDEAESPVQEPRTDLDGQRAKEDRRGGKEEESKKKREKFTNVLQSAAVNHKILLPAAVPHNDINLD